METKLRAPSYIELSIFIGTSTLCSCGSGYGAASPSSSTSISSPALRFARKRTLTSLLKLLDSAVTVKRDPAEHDF